jgi:hypothetical protein
LVKEKCKENDSYLKKMEKNGNYLKQLKGKVEGFKVLRWKWNIPHWASTLTWLKYPYSIFFLPVNILAPPLFCFC